MTVMMVIVSSGSEHVLGRMMRNGDNINSNGDNYHTNITAVMVIITITVIMIYGRVIGK